MVQPVCTCRVHWQNVDCPVHSWPQCGVGHEGEIIPRGVAQVPTPDESAPPLWLCAEHAQEMLQQGTPVQEGLGI